jgi:hypothetical protein
MTMGVGAGGCLRTVCPVCDATRGTGVVGAMVSASASAATMATAVAAATPIATATAVPAATIATATAVAPAVPAATPIATASAAPITSSLRCESLRQFRVQVCGEHDGSRGKRQPKDAITRNNEI